MKKGRNPIFGKKIGKLTEYVMAGGPVCINQVEKSKGIRTLINFLEKDFGNRIIKKRICMKPVAAQLQI